MSGQYSDIPSSGKSAEPIVINAPEIGKLQYATEKEEWHSISTEKTFDKNVHVAFRFRHDTIDTVFFRSYFFNYESKLPILSVSINPMDLWDSLQGIYVRGVNWYRDSATGKIMNANFNQKWEKEVSAIFIDTNNVVGFNQLCGLKLFGESTRRQPDKSMKLVARSKYGTKRFSYKMFSQKEISKFKQIAIRCSGNDYKGTRFKDVLSASVAENLGVDYMAFRATRLYVNGEDWGVYNLREKINEHYIAGNYDVDKDSVNIIMGRWVRQEGSAKRYMEMYRWFESLDTMDNKAYDKAKDFLEIRNYINYRCFQIFINNKDSRGNIRYFSINGSQPKFKMLLYDTDLGWGKYSFNFMEKVISPVPNGWYNPTWSTMYLRKLMQNSAFKTEFANQFAHLLNTEFNQNRIIAKVDSLEQVYQDELPRSSAGRPKHFKNVYFPMEEWKDDVNSFRSFAKLRPKVIWGHIEGALNLDGTYALIIDNDSSRFSIAQNRAQHGSFEGRYWKRLPIEVKMLDTDSLLFKCWSDGDTNRIKVVETSLDTLVLKPIYEERLMDIQSIELEEPITENEEKPTEEVSNSKLEDYVSWGALSLMALGLILIIIALFMPRGSK